MFPSHKNYHKNWKNERNVGYCPVQYAITIIEKRTESLLVNACKWKWAQLDTSGVSGICYRRQVGLSFIFVVVNRSATWFLRWLLSGMLLCSIYNDRKVFGIHHRTLENHKISIKPPLLMVSMCFLAWMLLYWIHIHILFCVNVKSFVYNL